MHFANATCTDDGKSNHVTCTFGLRPSTVMIDVSKFDEDLKFHCDALGQVEVARPIARYVILKCGSSQIGLMEKQAGRSRPCWNQFRLGPFDMTTTEEI
jgi:hypothetical protein